MKGIGGGSGAQPGNGGGKGGKTMTRTEFDALDPSARMAKIKDGVQVVDAA